ncbi:MAG: hypothetical protein GX115_08820 [Ruminiclostridium sp.]|nr:hypothetical protein [Ruminiclostridium sp.]
MKKLSFYFGLLLLVILVLFPGCSKNTKLKKNSITLDSSKKQSATVTELEGASFTVEYGQTTASVIAMPGVFPAGTSISITPLSKDKGLKGEKASACFELKAIYEGKSIQPSMPVFFTLAVEGDLPGTACLVAYDEGESIGYKVDSQILREDGISYVTAELNHFTIFIVSPDGTTIPPPPPKENDGEWKEWRFVANGPAEDFYLWDNEYWDFDAYMETTAKNFSGTIAGEYLGECVIKITGKVKEDIVPSETNMKLMGDINLTLRGNIEFTLKLKPDLDSNVPTELHPDDPFVDVGEWLSATGSVTFYGDASFDVRMLGPNVLPDAGYQDKTGAMDTESFYIMVNKYGANIEFFTIAAWDAVMVGVPKGGLSTDALNKTDTSSGTDILGSSNPSQQQGGLLNIFREGWPGESIPAEIPEYPKGDVVNSGGTPDDYAILVDNTTEEDLDEYMQTLKEKGWYTSSDYASKGNITLHFQFNGKNFLQITVYVEKLGSWPADKLPAEIVPPDKGMQIGDVEINDISDGAAAYYITFEYSGLSEDDVREYMQSYLDKGWGGDQYMVKRTIKWKGKQFEVDMEPYYDGGNVSFTFNLWQDN